MEEVQAPQNIMADYLLHHLSNSTRSAVFNGLYARWCCTPCWHGHLCIYTTMADVDN